MKSFTQRYKSGEINDQAIDKMIQQWHDSEEASVISLHEYIGMTEQEYSDWVLQKPLGPTRENKKRIVARSRKTRR